MSLQPSEVEELGNLGMGEVTNGDDFPIGISIANWVLIDMPLAFTSGIAE